MKPIDPNRVSGVGAGLEDPPDRSGLERAPDRHVSATAPSLEGRDVAAVAISTLFPGLGHALIGQSFKGVSTFLGVIAFTTLLGFLTCGVGFYAYLIFMPLFGVDAFMVATARKKRPVGPLAFFPSD